MLTDRQIAKLAKRMRENARNKAWEKLLQTYPYLSTLDRLQQRIYRDAIECGRVATMEEIAEVREILS